MFNKYSYDKLAVYFTLFFFLIALFVSNILEVPYFTDSFTYLNAAKDISTGKSYLYPFQPPGFSFLISIIGKYTYFDYFIIGKTISVIFSTIFIYVVYCIIKIIFNNEKIAFSSQLLVGSNSIVFSYSITPLTDMMFITLFYLSILYLIKDFNNPTYSSFIIAGIFGGLSYLTRYLSIILIFLVLIIILLLKNITIKNRLILISIYLFMFFLTASPWLIINYSENGSPFHNHLFKVAAFDIYGNEDYNQYDDISNRFNSLTEVIKSNPELFILHWMKGSIIGFIMIIGFLIFLKISKLNLNTRLLFLFSVLIIYYFTISIGHFEKRYLIPLIPLGAAIFFYSITNINIYQSEYRLFKIFNSKIFFFNLKIIILICIIILNILSGIEIMQLLLNQPFENKEAGAFLKHLGSPSESIIGDNRLIYYSKMKKSGMPQNLSNISDIDYIIYDEKYYLKKAPQYRYFLEKTNKTIPSNFELIYNKNEYPRIVIYKILKS